MNEELGRMCKELPWSVLRYSPSIFLERLKETTRNVRTVGL
jgi:hypothetical protein